MWLKSLVVLNRFSKGNLEVSFRCLTPSPISPPLRTVWVGQQEEAFTQTVFRALHVIQVRLMSKANLSHFSHVEQWVRVTPCDWQRN